MSIRRVQAPTTNHRTPSGILQANDAGSNENVAVKEEAEIEEGTRSIISH